MRGNTLNENKHDMALKKLTLEDIKSLSDKKICCYGNNPVCLQYICADPEVAKRICKIVTAEDNGKPGVFSSEGINIGVCGPEYLKGVDTSQTIVLITSDSYKEMYERLFAVEGFQADTVYYFLSKGREYESAYRDKYKNSPLEDIIIFRSGPISHAVIKGSDFYDNSRALFEYMLENGYNEKYELVWFVKNPSEFDLYCDIKNVKFLSFEWSWSGSEAERNEYYRALCLAKFIFFTDAYGFAKYCRKDQTRVQLWHGCGFKTRMNFGRCENKYEYMTVISELYAKIHREVYGLRSDQLLTTGYAKEDWLFDPLPDWREKLAIPKAGKYIFWAPTFRMATEQLRNLNLYELCGETGLPIVNTFDELARLDALLVELDVALLVKPHPFQDMSQIGNISGKNIAMLGSQELFEKDIPINRLLGHSDALISDYSSIAVDFMLLDKPIAFTLDDAEQFANSRGFVFDNIDEWLPGAKVYDFEDLCHFIKEIGDGIDSTKEIRRRLTAKMHKYHDGKSCERIIKALGI